MITVCNDGSNYFLISISQTIYSFSYRLFRHIETGCSTVCSESTTVLNMFNKYIGPLSLRSQILRSQMHCAPNLSLKKVSSSFLHTMVYSVSESVCKCISFRTDFVIVLKKGWGQIHKYNWNITGFGNSRI